MLSLQEFPGRAGPREAPFLDYAIQAYLPLVAATTVAPLVGLAFLHARAYILARRGRPLTRPGSLAYTIYLIAGLLPLMGGNAVSMKAILDNVYGSLGRWLYIRTWRDWDVYMGIAEFLSWFHLLAGLVLGMSLLLVFFRRSYDSWYADLLVYAGNAAWFIVLARIPLKDFHYTLQYVETHDIPPGARPFDVVAELFYTRLALGLAAGLAVSLGAYLLYKSRRARAGA